MARVKTTTRPTTVRQMWATRYPDSFHEVGRRLGMGAGMKEEEYPLEVRRALDLKYRRSRK